MKLPTDEPTEPLINVLVLDLNAVAHFLDFYSIQNAQVLNLRKHHFLIDLHGLLLGIRLNAPDKMQL